MVERLFLDTTSCTSYLLTPAMPGDGNLDGRVDINDLTIVLSHFGQTGATWSTGDFVGDGHVDINDLTIVLSSFGRISRFRRRDCRRAGTGHSGTV